MFWLACVVSVAAIDLGVKWYIKKYVKENSTLISLKDKVMITHIKNKGAMLGFLKNQARLLAGVTLLSIGFISGLLCGLQDRKGSTAAKLGLSLTLGGAISNAYERLTGEGVTDYIRFNVGPKKFRQTVFNIGDFFIFIGSFLALIGSLFGRSKDK